MVIRHTKMLEKLINRNKTKLYKSFNCIFVVLKVFFVLLSV